MNAKIRPWQISDLDNLVHYANNWNIARNLTNKFPHPYTQADGEWFISFALSHTPVQLFAIEYDGQAVGGIGLHLQDDIFCKNAELGYWLAEPFWGKGIVPGVVRQIVEYGFAQFDIDRIFARPFGSNTASQRVLEKTGFRFEARFEQTLYKHGEYHDELVYSIRRQ